MYQTKLEVMKFLIIILLFQYTLISTAQNTNDTYRTNLYTYAGIPQNTNSGETLKILVNYSYAVGYSEELKIPMWAVYRLGNKRDDVENTNWERPYRFIVDTRTETQVTHEDYNNNFGFDRGHLAPNAAMREQYGHMAQMETYFMTNICPQHRDLNRGIWMNLETIVRDELSQIDKNKKETHDLYVITGPIVNRTDLDTLDSGVIIPQDFYKILAFRKGYKGTVKAISFIFPHHPSTNNYLDYAVSIDEIEQRTGLNFFPELTESEQLDLESVKRDFNLDVLNN